MYSRQLDGDSFKHGHCWAKSYMDKVLHPLFNRGFLIKSFQSEGISRMEFSLKQAALLIFGLVLALPRVSKLLFGTGGSH